MLTFNRDTEVVDFLPPVRPPILHRRTVQAAVDTLALDVNERLAQDAARTLEMLSRMLGLDDEGGR